jgi:MFS family permease
MLPAMSGFWSVVAVYTCSAFGWAVIEPARKAMTAQVAGIHIARGFGLAEMSFGLGAVVGPLVGGYLYDNIDHSLPFILNTGVMLVSIALLLLFVRPALTIHQR